MLPSGEEASPALRTGGNGVREAAPERGGCGKGGGETPPSRGETAPARRTNARGRGEATRRPRASARARREGARGGREAGPAHRTGSRGLREEVRRPREIGPRAGECPPGGVPNFPGAGEDVPAPGPHFPGGGRHFPRRVPNFPGAGPPVPGRVPNFPLPVPNFPGRVLNFPPRGSFSRAVDRISARLRGAEGPLASWGTLTVGLLLFFEGPFCPGSRCAVTCAKDVALSLYPRPGKDPDAISHADLNIGGCHRAFELWTRTLR